MIDRRDRKAVQKLAVEMQSVVAEGMTFGELAEKFGVKLEDVALAVCRHWKWDTKTGQYVWPIELIRLEVLP